MIVLETALAAKFNETILEALGGRRTSGRLREHRRPAAEVRRDAGRCAAMKAYIAANTGL
jgi:threonine synthase